MTMYGGVEVELQIFLTSTLDGIGELHAPAVVLGSMNPLVSQLNAVHWKHKFCAHLHKEGTYLY
jgi:hypothetical protein